MAVPVGVPVLPAEQPFFLADNADVVPWLSKIFMEEPLEIEEQTAMELAASVRKMAMVRHTGHFRARWSDPKLRPIITKHAADEIVANALVDAGADFIASLLDDCINTAITNRRAKEPAPSPAAAAPAAAEPPAPAQVPAPAEDSAPADAPMEHSKEERDSKIKSRPSC